MTTGRTQRSQTLCSVEVGTGSAAFAFPGVRARYCVQHFLLLFARNPANYAVAVPELGQLEFCVVAIYIASSSAPFAALIRKL